ncbi:interleukin-6 receptor subunit beta-like protein [Lates japonicus]|uniref:Interleukin-6 receptor subunit beta-like protein n=1 Tax=Lates japonicus TaxID=270547 RepID=A0AAD3M9I1_LATJO|nr:interleukin-6 receptor subunit beta-like protein [Lates japonicus]
MDRPYLTQMALYLGFYCAAAKELLLSPSQPRCVFIAYDKVTCYWTPGRNSPANTVYTLQANVTKFGPTCDSFGKHAFNCTRINQTQCSGPMSSPDRLYSFRVVAHSATATASSPILCIKALDAVKLRKPVVSDLRPVGDKPRCLELQWHKPVKFALTNEEICTGFVNYQLQYSIDDQPKAQTVEGHLGEDLQPMVCKDTLRTNQTVRLRGPCSLSPFTQHAVRLRFRYLSTWSEWSNTLQSCTGIAAPIAAPRLWRTIKPTDDPQQRQVTLLWKSPSKSQTACISLWFNVHCQSEGYRSSPRTEKCATMTGTSCQLALPTERSSCFLAMCNSAGCSPAAQLTLPAPTDMSLRAMKAVSVQVLNESSLEVSWSLLTHSSLTGFLLEWEYVTEADGHHLHWERLSYNTSNMIITGLLSEVQYVVTVRPECGNEHGEAVSTQTYTRQGVPSTGPILQVKEQSNGAVLLKWTPLPVEEQHGFITHYSLYCQKENNTTYEVQTVPGEKLQYRLTGLSGVYQIFMTAHTVAGEGRASPPLWVTVGNKYSERTILICVFSPLITVVLLVTMTACGQRIKQNIWPPVPDPTLSSLAAWISDSEHTTKKFCSDEVTHMSTCKLTNAVYDTENR